MLSNVKKLCSPPEYYTEARFGTGVASGVCYIGGKASFSSRRRARRVACVLCKVQRPVCSPYFLFRIIFRLCFATVSFGFVSKDRDLNAEVGNVSVIRIFVVSA